MRWKYAVLHRSSRLVLWKLQSVRDERASVCSDAAKLEALNLNPGVPRVPEEVRRDFLQFKTQSTQQHQQQPPKP